MASLRIGLAALALALAAAAPSFAGTPKPSIVIERPGQCVEDAATMRRDHMKLLLHQRERTVREGIRTARHSLNGCIECHASRRTGSVLGEQGFCQSCHSYAGVRLDCFECHRPSVKPAHAQPAALGGRR